MRGSLLNSVEMSRPDRRQLRFSTTDEAVAEAELLVEAEKEGRLQRCGNWTLGQVLGHLATWANFAFDGYPAEVHAPFFVRWIVRMFRGQILRKGMMAGVRVGKVPGGTVGLDLLEPEEGLRRFRAAMERLKSAAPTAANPVFGRMTHEQWIALNLRHAELHMSFLLHGARNPDDPGGAPAEPACLSSISG
jgi:hypothetical protein